MEVAKLLIAYIANGLLRYFRRVLNLVVFVTVLLGFLKRTIEASIKKLVDLKRLEKIGQGRATRYQRLGK